MSATLVHRGPDADGIVRRRPGRPRRAAALDHRPRDRRPADRERGRHASSSSRTARSTTTASCARARARRASLPRRTATPRCSSTRYEEWGTRVRRAAARHVRVRDLGRARAAARARARPLRDQAALLPRRTATRSRSRPSCARCRAARSTSTRSRRSSRSTRVPGAALDLPRHAQAAARHLLVWERRRVELAALRAAGADAASRRASDDEAELVEELRARLRDSVRAHLVSDVPVGVLLSGGVDSCMLAALAAEETARAAADVLDRLRGALVRRARRRAARRASATAPSTASSCCGPTRRCSCPALADGLRRAVRRLVGAADVPRLAARGRGREGRALRRGRRRAVRRLLHVRGRPARASGSAGSRRRRGRSSSGCRRRRARASFDYRAKRFVRAAHLPPLERHHGWKEIFSPDARAELTGTALGVRSGRPAARALRRDRGRRRCSRGCRTSTSARTSSTTCS